MSNDPGRPVLALNAGSSSLKFGLFMVGASGSRVLVSGAEETVGEPQAAMARIAERAEAEACEQRRTLTPPVVESIWSTGLMTRFNPAEATQRMDSYKEKKKGQPYSLPSSGCIFKNPKIAPDRTISAGMLIDQCGLKGFRIGGAQISHIHANIMVNLGGATATEVRALIAHAQHAVSERFDQYLIPEIGFIGEFLPVAHTAK